MWKHRDFLSRLVTDVQQLSELLLNRYAKLLVFHIKVVCDVRRNPNRLEYALQVDVFVLYSKPV